MAFEISDSSPQKQRDILAKRDKVIRNAQEREKELRRRKFDHEEQKRSLQEREKLQREETENDLKRLEAERREAILKNHKVAKSTSSLQTRKDVSKVRPKLIDLISLNSAEILIEPKSRLIDPKS